MFHDACVGFQCYELWEAPVQVFQDISFEKNKTIFSKPMLSDKTTLPLEEGKSDKISWYPEDEPAWSIYGLINETEQKIH